MHISDVCHSVLWLECDYFLEEQWKMHNNSATKNDNIESEGCTKYYLLQICQVKN